MFIAIVAGDGQGVLVPKRREFGVVGGKDNV